MALTDAKACDHWHKNLEEGDVSAIIEENILSAFEQLHLTNIDVFERGLINVLKCRGITKPIILAASVRNLSLTIW